MRALPLFHRVAGQPVIVLGKGAAAEAKRRLVERAGGLLTDDPHADARLAFVALDAPEATVRSLRERGVLVNVPDRPDLCDFTVPSLVDREPLLVAVGTGGASAGLAKHVRLRLERILPAGIGRLADALHAARGVMRARWSDPAQRRRALDAALAEGGLLDPLDESAAERVAAWLVGTGEPAEPRQIELVLTSDDPDDLTVGQARLLGMADAVAFDAHVHESILDRARADAVRLPLPHAGDWPPGLILVVRRA